MSNKNVSFRDLINEIYRLDELFIAHESRQFPYLLKNESSKEEFYNEYKKAFQELLIAAIQRAKFPSEIAEVIDFFRQSYRFMEYRGELRDLFEEMATAAFNKAREIAAAQIKPRSILESAVFRAVNFGFVETFAVGAFRLFNSFKSGDTQTIRPTIETKSSGFPLEAKARAPYEKQVLPTGSAGHHAKSMKIMSRREAVAGSDSAKPKTIPESAGFRALRYGFVETFVAGFWRLVKWFKPDNAQTIRPVISTTGAESKTKSAKETPEIKNLAKNTKAANARVATRQRKISYVLDAVDLDEGLVVQKSNQSRAPELSEIVKVFPRFESKLKLYQAIWRSRSQRGTTLVETSASPELK